MILAGAGPGDPDLITVRAMRFLEAAEVVIVDRLVSHEILERYVSPFAEVIYAGKQAGKAYSTRQTTINQLLVDHANAGKLVVRLKGGDVSIFSNILDELQALTENGIPYEIVPGITAALGAAAYAGIPLTARDHSTGVRFLTSYKDGLVADDYWRDLAATSDTVVFYMSGENLRKVIEKLVSFDVDKRKSVALIEQATTPLQKVTIIDLEKPAIPDSFVSPALVIVGYTVALHEQFKWLANYSGHEYYFQPLTRATSQVSGKSTVFS